jgi:hypothetical protein
VFVPDSLESSFWIDMLFIASDASCMSVRLSDDYSAIVPGKC